MSLSEQSNASMTSAGPGRRGGDGAGSERAELEKAQVELRAAKEAAEEANQAKDRFLAILSHELRTPLSPILAAVQALELENNLPPQVREALDVIKRNAELEARLIDDLLDVTRVTRGTFQLYPRPVDAHRLVARAVEIARSEIDPRRHPITLELRAQASTVNADSARLLQILWNLLTNGVKFTPDGGTIVIRSYNRANELVLEVADPGVGISAEAMSRIFLPFEQSPEHVGARVGGLGLGLSIARTLTDLHGGRLEALSDGVGRGAVFRLTLPIVSPQARDGDTREQRRNDSPPAAPAGRQRRLRILLVEDHEDTVRAMSWLLRRIGHEVSVARTVRDAIAEANRTPFDLLISDIGLPDGTGWDVIRQMPRRDMPAIALTGFGMEQDVARSLAAGFTEHLTKPVNFQKLEAVIHTLAADDFMSIDL
jgi:signal transduction histidine kinase/ActR/RegA family two-component response regulator